MDNFEFLKHIDVNPDLYECAHELEQSMRIDYDMFAKACRRMIEVIVDTVESEHHVKLPKGNDKISLNDRITNLQKKKYLVSMDKVTFKTVENKQSAKDFYTFIRWFGNSGAHENTANYYPKLCFSNIQLCVKMLHQFFNIYYRDKINKKTKYMLDYAPIGLYNIEQAYIPNDAVLTNCVKEYLAYTLDRMGKKQYAIIREYKKIGLKRIFLSRNIDAYNRANELSFDGISNIGVTVEELGDIKDDKVESYFVIYRFSRKPISLTKVNLKELDIQDRLNICVRIAKIFESLHNPGNEENAIYHRMLTRDSIYLMDISDISKREKYAVAVTKFEFSKLENYYEAGTVIALVKDSSTKKKSQYDKYIAPEHFTFEKRDLYALGVLFNEILCGEFNNQVDAEMLLDEGVDENLAEIIYMMQSKDQSEIPNIDEVLMFLKG